MSEAYRRKGYYRTRVLIGLGDVLDSSFPDALLCLSGGELNILRNLMQYATRRANWVDSYHTAYYLTPDDTDWDTVQGIVSELEGKLMSDCTDLMDKLDDIYDAVACICPNLRTAQSMTVISPETMQQDDVADYFDYSDNIPNGTEGSAGDTDACEKAQLWYQAGYELITEKVLPSVRFGFDVLVPAAAAAIVVMTGGAALPAAIGTYAVAELIQELLEVFYDAAESNLQNWLWSAKEDLVCEMYRQLQSGGDVTTMWQAVYNEVVAPSEDISGGDKATVNLFMSGLAYFVAKTAWTEDSAWAQLNISANYCDDCPDVPVVGTDWWALPLLAEDNTVHMNHPSGGYWLDGCWQFTVPTGQTLCGYVFEVVTYTAGCTLKRMGSGEAGCDGAQLTANTSENLGTLTFFAADGANIDEAACKAALAPTATTISKPYRRGAGEVNQGFNLGWNCTGNKDVIFKWAIFEGTTPSE